MSDLDVALRLRLENKLSREAERAERDLKQLKKAAEGLNRRSGNGLERELKDVSRTAREAGRALDLPAEKMRALDRLKTNRVEAELKGLKGVGQQVGQSLKIPADRLRELNRLRTDRVEGELKSLGTASNDLGAKIGAALGKLRAVDTIKTDKAEAEFKSLGETIKNTATRLDKFQKASGGKPGSSVPGAGVPGVPAGRRQNTLRAAESLYDRTPLGAYVPLGAGGGAAAGAGIAAGGLAAVQGFRKFASADRRMTVLGMGVGASEEETKRVGSRVRKLATDLGIPHEQAVAGLDDIVAAGVENFDEALAMLPTALKAAISSGTSSAQMATALKATSDSMKLGKGQLPLAADTIITGGRMGKFEVEDMARYLPSLLPLAAGQLGYSGLGGLQQVAADLQTVRDKSGTSEEAATRVADFYSKIFSETMQKNFADAGFNLKRTVDTAVAQGEDPVAAAIELTRKAVEKDPTSLSNLFTDKEARMAALAFLSDPAARGRYREGMQGATGTTEESFARVSNDAQASIDRLSNGSGNLLRGLGAVLDKAGVPSLLNTAGKNATVLAEDGFAALLKRQIGLSWLFNGEGKPTPKQRPATSPFPSHDLADPESALDSYLNGSSVPVPLPKPKLGKLSGKLGAAGQAAGRDFAAALGGEAERVGAIADELKARFSFTATPTIAPTFSAAQAAPASARGGGAANGPTTINQRINGTSDPVRTARAVTREQNRAIRSARARALHDLGSLA